MPNRWKPNVTVAAVIERDGRYLLVEEQTPEGLRLNNPAGHLDPGESLVQAVRARDAGGNRCTFAPDRAGGRLPAAPAPQNRRQAEDGETSPTCASLSAAGLGDSRPSAAARPRHRAHGLDDGRRDCAPARPRHRSPLLLQCVEDYAGRQAPSARAGAYGDLRATRRVHASRSVPPGAGLGTRAAA